jgi:hypothetical protein
VAHAVAIAAKPAAEATQQDNYQDDDEDQSKRHGTLPKRRAADDSPPSRFLLAKHIPGQGSTGEPEALSGCGKEPVQRIGARD